MLLKAYVDVPVNLAAYKATFSWEPERCFGGLGERAREEGERLLAEAGLASEPGGGDSPQDGGSRDRPARLHIGGVLVREHLVTVPVELAVKDGGRFPALLGTIDAAWLGPERSYVSLSLQYEMPHDLHDRSVERTVFHRVVEVVAQHLLVNVAECLCVNCSVNPTYTMAGRTASP